MTSIFSEEDLYDMGLEPFAMVEERQFLRAYTDLLDSDKFDMGPEWLPIQVFPAVGVTVPFPRQIIQLEAATPVEIAIARHAFDNGMPLFIGVSTPDCFLEDNDFPAYNRVRATGCVGRIRGLSENGPNPGLLLNVELGERAVISAELTKKCEDQYKGPFVAMMKQSPEQKYAATKENKALLKECCIWFDELMKRLGTPWSDLLAKMLKKTARPADVINFLCLHAPCDREKKYELLEMERYEDRLKELVLIIPAVVEELPIRMKVIEKVNEQMSQQRRDNFLQNQMNAIRSELGDNYEENSDIKELQERSEKKKWSETIAAYFRKELRKLERYNVTMPEYSIQYSYLDMLLNLPWDETEAKDISLAEVRKSLDEDHYGLEKVKERIVEHVAVQKQRNDMKSPILCLSGAPGVGKTSLGKSIAKALGREYQRIALGGVSDEAEIRGHRRTYVGAMAGRIMAALSKCKSNNPVILLDEIDKIGKGLRGDPGQALLEVLDPEQNSAFHDNYIDIDYDLSKVFFIATANNLGEVSEPLLDRMEVIPLSGYILEEKEEIAKRHLIPKSLEKNGFAPGEISLTSEGIRKTVESYTRESGVRQLEKKIESLLRKTACRKVEGKQYAAELGPEEIQDLLGKEEFQREVYEDNSYPGVVTGLAWTSAGGEILFVETSVSEGKGDKLTLTGNLGNVMKESAAIALEYLRSHPGIAGIDAGKLKKSDIHVHVPEGAVPKDGPSAGITITTSIASALTGRKVREKLAMTGEMTLRGKVLPVGGIKEKILAAQRDGIREIVMSSQNRKDVEEIPGMYLKHLSFHYVDHISQVLEYALLYQ